MPLLLRLLGLAVLATVALTVGGAILTAMYAAVRGKLHLQRLALLASGVATAELALLIGAGPLLTRERVLSPGSELSFCGFDCHLHLSARPAPGRDGVIVRFRSDARAVRERPGALRIVGYDARGARHAALEPIPDIPLPAGESVEHLVRFAVGPGERIERITAIWRDWESYLVPGPENPLVQRQTSVALLPQAEAPRRAALAD
ncbi:MAG TPA: hypothetical protein VFU00_11745 [Gemmatimonadales bacterium]|nr:hypothetical protein [Gemmatimonadales bacterium]